MLKKTAILIGGGARGKFAYSPYAHKYPHELQFVAIAEPVAERREDFAASHAIAPELALTDWKPLLDQGKIADVAIICTQDRMHFEPTMRALELGYDVLLEKPMSPLPEECLLMEEAARKHGRILMICHVLRHTPFWSTIKRTVEAGEIGEVVSIQLNENVGYFHAAHSFVRGLWRDSDESSPMILQKSCHDMDILSWIVGRECRRISSYGSLHHFRQEHAPAGAALRCTDGCPAEASCPYSALKIYLGEEGEPWSRFITADTSPQGILTALREGPFGRCVYHCDNNVVDHQVVNMEFEGGVTASFSMSSFTHDCSRSVQIMGTHGEIRGYMEDNRITVYPFGTRQQVELSLLGSIEGHGGGDEGLMRAFLKQVREQDSGGLTSATAALESHLMAFAAEASRLAQGQSIELSDYKRKIADGLACKTAAGS